MNVKVLEKVESSALKSDIPEMRVGDTIKLGLRVADSKEGERIQNFEGVLIRMSGSGIRKTLTIRKIGANGVGVERIVPVHAPVLSTIAVTKKGRARRARLYYLRDKIGKAALAVKE